MPISNQKILIAIIVVTLLLFPLVAFTSGVPRIIFGLCLVLFFPGYTLLSALFPRKGDLAGVERIALSFGLSIAVVPLIGLILNYTLWGITLYPILISITGFILACSAVSWRRQLRLPLEERFSIIFNFKLSQWAGMGKLDKALSVGLAVAIVASLGFLAYGIAQPKPSEKFTEFYILGPEGKAEDYHRELMVGEEAMVILGIVNHEHQPTSYQVEIDINGNRDKELATNILADEAKWEQEVSFVLDEAGLDQKIEFWLYQGEGTEPCLKEPLRLYIDVRQE
jgi:uncharacterized membrane protein